MKIMAFKEAKKRVYYEFEKLVDIGDKIDTLKEIRSIKNMKELKEYVEKLDTALRKEWVIAGEKIIDANIEAAEAYVNTAHKKVDW